MDKKRELFDVIDRLNPASIRVLLATAQALWERQEAVHQATQTDEHGA